MERNKILDITKGIAILMIVDIHLQSGAVFSIGKTFHVVTFFVVSGIIAGGSAKYETDSANAFVYRKIKGLMYPYVGLSIVYVILLALVSLQRTCSLYSDRVYSAIVKTVTFQGIGTLWFLPVMFFAELIAFSFIKKLKRLAGIQWGIFTAIISIYISCLLENNKMIGWPLNGWGIIINGMITLIMTSFIAAGFIMIGYAMSRTFFKLSVNNNIVILFIGALTMFSINKYFVRFYAADLHKLKIGNPGIFLLCSFSGILFVLIFACILSHVKYVNLLFSFLGKNSLIIMTTHKEYYVNYVVYLSLIKLFGNRYNYLLFGTLSLVVIVMIEAVIILIVVKTPIRFLYKPPIIIK